MERIGSSRRDGIFDPDHRPYGQHRVGAESERDGGEEPGDAEVEPVDGDQGAGRAGGEAQRIGRQPVSTTTDKLVIAVLMSPGTPTLRISANSSRRRRTPRNE